MNILILGGTGAIGRALIDLLKSTSWNVLVTSRNVRENENNIRYIKGNAHEGEFLKQCLEIEHWNAIVDFMAYSTKEFSEKVDLFLNKTDQYFFLSSSRVYAESNIPTTENSKRLIDVCEDEEYLKTDEYALAKARQENILFNSSKKNWTIIRPYKTYNDNRFQLGMFEKEDWLYRVMMGKTLVFPKEMAKKKTTLTNAIDVSVAIKNLIGNQAAYGEAFHITTTESITWQNVLDIYIYFLQKSTGKHYKIKYIDNIEKFYEIWNKYQIKYDCNIDRIFDNSKINNVINKNISYTRFEDGCVNCMNNFLDNPSWRRINWKLNFWMNTISNEKIAIWNVMGKREKLRFIKYFFSK